MKAEKRLEDLRDRLAADPAGVKAEILNELSLNREVITQPSVRIRFYGLLIACCRNLGDFDGGLQALEVAEKIEGSPGSQAELLNQAASLHIERRDADAALKAVETSQALLRGELDKIEGDLGSARGRRLLRTLAWELVVRGEITLHLKAGSLREAMSAALEAIALASHKSALRVRMAAITLLSGLLMRFGTLAEVTEALKLLDQSDRELARRRIRRSHDFRIRIRWGKALAMARLGMIDRAEQIMTEVIEQLMQDGAHRVAEDAVAALAWIVEERAGQQGRAAYLRRRYRARLAEGVES